ncbi:MAG: lysine--tRNA ligase [Fidelibacterota bacterium]|nr:MAG: lysine--tRNA ligase [Candidatus Neomarinimicrobiota bacterium]
MTQPQRTLHEIRLIRQKKLHELRDMGINPYPYRFEVTHHSADIQIMKDDEYPPDVAVAGRVVSLRRMGKASFAHLMDVMGKQQIYVKMDLVGEDSYEEVFRRVDLGDFLGVRGRVFRTKTGEITVEARTLELLAKSLRPLPNLKEKEGEVFDPFEDKENRYRRRYLDLIANPQVKEVFIKRAQIIRFLRQFMDDHGYIEVETPALQPLYGGASARPFTTYHNALDRTLYLRVADELYLKRLIIGGFEKVYEIAKDFRNEGMDRYHNPEFTALEYYQAYADYNDMLTFTEGLFKTVAEQLDSTIIVYQGHEIDFSPSFARAGLFDLLRKYTDEDLGAMTDVKDLYRFARDRNLDVAKGLNYGQVLEKIFGLLVEPQLVQPTFVVGYPKVISPLAKTHRDGPDNLVERFELFIAGMEFANAFSELNDPLDQRTRLEDQARLREAGDEEAQVVDEEFLEAMEFGMPPTGGVGIGVDRLVMLFTGQDSIKDVILFPAMRPIQL